MTDSLRITLLQTEPRLGDVDGNANRLAEAASATSNEAPHIAVSPELSLTGYDLRDRAVDTALEPGAVARRLARAGSLVVGVPERASDGALYNSAVHVDGGRVVHVHRKVYLPTYGMFDEARIFAAGADVVAYDHGGWRVGLLVCEDYWHPGLVYALAAQRIELLIAIAAAPGRGVLDDTSADARFASWQTWRRMAEVYARVLGIYVALANRCGVEEGVTFAGGSFVCGPDGAMLAELGPEPGSATAALSKAELARQRTPAWHGRDDRPLVVARALLRAEGIDA
ncbi:MAG TPA: nitrilase-related carbon-nitrogen hydrolase [Longimicrobiales bacterium]